MDNGYNYLMYKILFTDIDGTAAPTCGNKTSETVAECLRRLERNGVPVCLNTGRNVAFSMPIINHIGLKSPISAVDGLYVYDPVSSEILYENKLPIEIAETAVEISRESGMFVEIINAFDYYRCLNGKMKFDYDAGFGNIINYITDIKEAIEKCGDCAAIVLAGEDSEIACASRKLKEIGENSLVIREMWGGYLHVSPKKTGKAEGMKFICDYYNFSLSQAVAIGDFANDADMLTAAGMGVAMGNASDEIKNICGCVTETVENDGVAAAVANLFKMV